MKRMTAWMTALAFLTGVWMFAMADVSIAKDGEDKGKGKSEEAKDADKGKSDEKGDGGSGKSAPSAPELSGVLMILSAAGVFGGGYLLRRRIEG